MEDSYRITKREIALSSPQVSIIIPVYNVSDYIERCILSVINQTYHNIECIVVDDGSPDDSMEKCYSLINHYVGPILFSVVAHERNLGLSAARNTGIDKSNGDYIFFLDGDDELLPYSIQCMVDITELYPKVEMVQGLRIKPRNNVNRARTPRFLYNTDYIEDNNWVRAHFYCLGDRLPVQVMNKLIKKEFLLKHHLYFKVGLIHEDNLWMYFLVKKLEKFAVVKKETYIYHENPYSIMSTRTPARTAYNWSIILQEVLATLDNPYYEGQLFAYLNRLVKYYDGSWINYKKYMLLTNGFSVKLLQCSHWSLALCICIYMYTLPFNILKIGKYLLMKKIKNVWIQSIVNSGAISWHPLSRRH